MAPGELTTRAASTTTQHHGRLVLVTIDGARWQDVFEGSDAAMSGEPSIPAAELMPRTHALVAAHGVAIGATLDGCGRAHTAGASNVSLPGYQEIFTGHASHCLDNQCAPVADSVLDEGVRAGLANVASIGSWDVLARAVSSGTGGVFVSVGRTGSTAAAQASVATLIASAEGVDPYPGHDGYRPDSYTAPIALEYLRAYQPALLHIGLGDTDEYGHRGDYPGYLAALRHADTVIGQVADVLATMGEEGRNTTVLVTPDHGRNSDFRDHGVFRPESGRTFVFAFGGPVAARGIACSTGDVTLADIAPTIRALTGLGADATEGAGRPIHLITEAP